MAERRMFAKSVVLSDKFQSMPMSARNLYFNLGMVADDDGFLDTVKQVMRSCGVNKRALQALVDGGYVQCFDSGVLYIVHWSVNNQLRKDRHRPTVHRKELEQVVFDAVPVNPV